jgi:hypothetical protein
LVLSACRSKLQGAGYSSQFASTRKRLIQDQHVVASQ